jgi:hypothetical protein
LRLRPPLNFQQLCQTDRAPERNAKPAGLTGRNDVLYGTAPASSQRGQRGGKPPLFRELLGREGGGAARRLHRDQEAHKKVGAPPALACHKQPGAVPRVATQPPPRGQGGARLAQSLWRRRARRRGS